MKTVTTVEAVERTPKGAFKVTFPGNVIAGTLDAEIGALAEKLVADENANPVEIHVEEIGGGRLEIKGMEEITQGDALDVPADPTPEQTEAVAAEEPAAGEVTPETAEVAATLDQVLTGMAEGTVTAVATADLNALAEKLGEALEIMRGMAGE